MMHLIGYLHAAAGQPPQRPPCCHLDEYDVRAFPMYKTPKVLHPVNHVALHNLIDFEALISKEIHLHDLDLMQEAFASHGETGFLKTVVHVGDE